MLHLLFGSVLSTLITFLAMVLCLVYAYFKNAFAYWSDRDVPTVVPTIPFGNSAELVLMNKSFGEFTRDLYNELKLAGKPYGGYYLFAKPILLVLDPELAKNVLTIDFQHFYTRNLYCNEEGDPLSANLVSLSGEKWRNMRTKLTPTFSSGKMKMMFHILVTCGEELEKVLRIHAENQEPLEVKDVMGKFTTDIIAACAFGFECNSLKDPDNIFRKYGKRVFELTNVDALVVIFSNFFPKFYASLNRRRLPKDVDDFFINLVYDTVEYREKNNILRKDFMDLLIKLKNKGTIEDDAREGSAKCTNLTMNEIAAQAFVFFLAGFETSSTTMSFAMYDLVTHPIIQDKVREEIHSVLDRHNGEVTYDSVQEMTYLDKVLNESLRLHAGIPNLLRKCTKDYLIPNSDVLIKSGTTVIIPTLGFQSDPKYFPNPELFDPERFSPEEKSKRHPYTFLPFGEGPRNCIGLRFGLMQSKVGLLTLLKNHRYTLSGKTRTPLEMDPRCNIFSVLGGIWVNAETI